MTSFGKLLPWLPRVVHLPAKVGHSCFLLWDVEEVGEDVAVAVWCSCIQGRLCLASCVSAW